MISTAGKSAKAPARKPSCANASSSGDVRRRSSVDCAVVMFAVLMVPRGSPVAVPSGMRNSGLRGGGNAGEMAPCRATAGWGAVFDAVDETVADELVFALRPGAVSDSGAGAVFCDGAPNPLRRTGARRFRNVETNPVVPAPDPAALP